MKQIMKKRNYAQFFVGGLTILFLGVSSCTSPGKRTGIGAGAGAAGGAGIGAIIGGGKGALIGAGIGALAGGVVGNRLDKQSKELEKVAQTKRTDQGIIVSLKNDVLFPTGSSQLNSGSEGQITQLAAVLAKYPTDQILIAGYTDNKGSDQVNNSLSLQRAQAVQAVLLRNGVPAGQTTVQGYGKNNPVATNDTEAGRAQNRRVVLQITDIEANKK